METYSIHYSTGTNRNDEKRYVRKVSATSLADVALQAHHIEILKKAVVTAIELDRPAFS